MDIDVADSMKDTIAFLVARYKDDEEAGKVILGIHADATDEEMEATAAKVVDMLLLMTDFALGQVQMLAMIVGVTPEKFLATLGIQMARMEEWR